MTTTGNKHPRALYALFATEMWERFSFYTMLSLLVLYLTNPEQGFGWTKAQATSLYANYLMFVYASPILGGWIADRVTGFRLAITIGGIFFIAGHVLMAFPYVPAVYAALTCLVIGNGFFKPNISVMVGTLYPDGSHLKDSAFNIFYMGINIGAFLAPVIAETMMQRYGFHLAFGTAGVGMVIAMAVFWSFKKVVEEEQKEAKSPHVSSIPKTERQQALEQVPDNRRILALLVIFAIVVIFWMTFHQNFSTLTYWANDNTDWTRSRFLLKVASILTLGTVQPDVGNVSGVISNVINPFFVITFSLPLVALWRWLDRRKKEPSTPVKMAFGMFLTSFSFYLLFFAARAGGDWGKVSPWWLIGSYAILTTGELCLSPMGLSLVSKVAPKRLKGLMMGAWFLATAIGNKLTAIGIYWEVWSHSQFFLILATIALATAFILLLLLKPLKKAMPGV